MLVKQFWRNQREIKEICDSNYQMSSKCRQGKSRDKCGCGGRSRQFPVNSLINSYKKKLFYQNRGGEVVSTLLQCQSLPTSFHMSCESKYSAYIVNPPLYKLRRGGNLASVGVASFYRQHLCGGKWTIGYNEFDFFKRKLRIQTFWWLQNWNLRHIYKICFLIFWAFFALLASKFSISANMTKKIFFLQKNLKRYQKMQNFTPILNAFEKVVKKCTQKSYKQNKFDKQSKSEKSAYFRHVFANNFFWVHFFTTFSTESKSAWNSAFLIHILNFSMKIFFVSY